MKEPRKIVEYSIAFSITSYDLEKKVNSLIKNGWEPIGGLSVIDSHASGHRPYSQAMVKYE